ncbi:MAG: GTPase Era [Alphaproteobacteria bacterium]|nr:GTPase Era [Alphaproteobacteria bacterium]
MTRCGYAALLGAANVGKSTLANAIVGAKVAIVSAKAQTTRARVTGIAIAGGSQIVLLDLPGIFVPKRRLDHAMIDAAWRGAEEADRVLFIVDAVRGLDDTARLAIEGLGRCAGKIDAVINKIDAVKRPALLGLAKAVEKALPVEHIFMVSAESGDGVADLKDWLAARMPEGPWLFPEDQLMDLSERLFAAEITREQIFRQLHEELPYSAAVTTESWKEQADGSARVDQTILVEREGQKGIVIGAKGARLKAIGSAARAELVKSLGRPIHLFLHVKVTPSWGEQPEHYRDWGLEFTAMKAPRR